MRVWSIFYFKKKVHLKRDIILLFLLYIANYLFLCYYMENKFGCYASQYFEVYCILRRKMKIERIKINNIPAIKFL